MTKFVAMIVMNLVTPKVVAKRELLFNKPAFVQWQNPTLLTRKFNKLFVWKPSVAQSEFAKNFSLIFVFITIKTFH